MGKYMLCYSNYNSNINKFEGLLHVFGFMMSYVNYREIILWLSYKGHWKKNKIVINWYISNQM